MKKALIYAYLAGGMTASLFTILGSVYLLNKESSVEYVSIDHFRKGLKIMLIFCIFSFINAILFLAKSYVINEK